MSRRRLNFTSRRRIPRDAVSVQVYEDDPRTFDATLNLSVKDYPPHAAVVLEATSSGSQVLQRFEFGTIAEMMTPSDRRLTDITGENVIFGVKVVDRQERIGRILGLLTGIRPERPNAPDKGRVTLLPVEPIDLGHQIWRLRFTDETVVLEVNRRIPMIMEIVSTDSRFLSVVYPEIVRQVLDRVVAMEGVSEQEGDSDHWCQLWLRFAISLHPEHLGPPVIEDAMDTVSRADLDIWLNDVADGYAGRFGLRDKMIEICQAE